MSEKTNETLKIIHSLGSTRNFSRKEISDKDLKSILNAAIRAPNSSGRQAYSIIVVKEKPLLDKFFYSSQIALLFCVDFNRMLDYAQYLNKPLPHLDLIKFITCTIDTLLVAQTANIAAKSLGIDSLFTNSIHRQKLDEIYNTFNLPGEYCFPLISLCLGYSDNKSSNSQSKRKGRMYEGVIHMGEYQHLTKDQLSHHILAYDDDKQHLASRSSSQVKEMGFEHFLDWFFSKWWTPNANHDKIKEFTKKLNEVGFLS